MACRFICWLPVLRSSMIPYFRYFPKQMKASCRSLNSPSPSIGRVNKMDVYWFLVGSPMILYFYRLKNSKKSFYEKPVLPSLFDSENMSVVGFFLWCKLNRCRLFYEECKIIFLYFHFTQQFDLGPSWLSVMALKCFIRIATSNLLNQSKPLYCYSDLRFFIIRDPLLLSCFDNYVCRLGVIQEPKIAVVVFYCRYPRW